MDIEKVWTLEDSNFEHLEGSDKDQKTGEKLRSKTSMRIHFEAQVEAIKKQTGDLEHIRQTLNLSQRKICQLLMVDPSAWSRWTKGGGEAPPHIYRALQWYMILQDKIPGLSAPYFIGRFSGQDPVGSSDKAMAQFQAELLQFRRRNEILDQEKNQLQEQIQQLQNQVQANRAGFYFLVAALLIISIGLAMVFQFFR